MACLKLGSKPDSFKRQGQAWFSTTDPPSDVTIEVGDMSFHLHKFPLLSKSGVLRKLIVEATTFSSSPSEEPSVIKLPDLPGGARAFELVARFCYGVELQVAAANSVLLRCAAQHLDMSEEVCERNLIALTEAFSNKVVLRSWKDSLKALQSCEEILPYCENLGSVNRCIDSLAAKACAEPDLSSLRMDHGGGAMQSPGESVLWNGIGIEARPRNLSPDWWYDDAASLSFSMYARLIEAMKLRGIRQEIVAGSSTHFAKKPQKLSMLPRTHAAQNERLP